MMILTLLTVVILHISYGQLDYSHHSVLEISISFENDTEFQLAMNNNTNCEVLSEGLHIINHRLSVLCSNEDVTILRSILKPGSMIGTRPAIMIQRETRSHQNFFLDFEPNKYRGTACCASRSFISSLFTINVIFPFYCKVI